MDLRNEFEKTLRRWGHDVYLQKRTNPHESVEVEYSNTLERITVRHTYPANRGLPASAVETLAGVVHEVELIYYLQHHVEPREGDRIYENIANFPDELTTYLIDYALPMKGLHGRIEFWTIGASRESPE